MSEQKNAPVFLLNGMRLKLSFNDIDCDECGSEHDSVTCEPLGMYANELQGRWVALVSAEDDRHLELLKLTQQRDDLLAAIKAIQTYADKPQRLDGLDKRAIGELARAAIARAEGREVTR